MIDESESAGSHERRKLFKVIIAVSAVAISAITLIPSTAFILGPAFSGGQRRRRKVIFQNPAESEPKTFVPARYEGQEETAPGIFVRFDQGKPIVLSARCTHAACSVNWNASENKFICPCHQGHFDVRGKNISGPPPKPLEALVASVNDGQVFILEPEA